MKPPEDLQIVTAKDLPPLIKRRFEENNGKLGTLMYIKYQYGVHYSDGRTLLRMANTTDNVKLWVRSQSAGPRFISESKKK